jgi:hypothetical protein
VKIVDRILLAGEYLVCPPHPTLLCGRIRFSDHLLEAMQDQLAMYLSHGHLACEPSPSVGSRSGHSENLVSSLLE